MAGVSPFEPFDVDPVFHAYVMRQAAYRLAGKERHKKRPYLGLKSIVSGVAFTVKPSLLSSPAGWVLDGVVTLTVQVRSKNSSGAMQDFKIPYRLHADGSAKPRASWRLPGLNDNIKEAALTFINMVASDPDRYIPLLNENHCGMCGKGLTDPESMSVGIGPECIKTFRLLVESTPPEDFHGFDALVDEIKDLRRQMQQAHPDKGGDADVLIQLRKEFERLKAGGK